MAREDTYVKDGCTKDILLKTEPKLGIRRRAVYSGHHERHTYYLAH